MTSKALLRLEALELLTKLDERRREEAALAAFLFLTSYLKNTRKNVLSFASKPLEINLWPLNQWLSKNNTLFLSKIENQSLVPYEVSSFEELISSKYLIKEPDPQLCRKAFLEEIDVILVPALYFDSNFDRLGYGKGYFDRFLSTASHALKWGIGFKEQKINKIPQESHDIRLDEVFLF